MTNAQRQANFRRLNPGYYSRLRKKRLEQFPAASAPATQESLTDVACSQAETNPSSIELTIAAKPA